MHINYAMCAPPGIGDVSHTNDKELEGDFGLGLMEDLDDSYNTLPFLVGPKQEPRGDSRRFLGGEQFPISGKSGSTVMGGNENTM